MAAGADLRLLRAAVFTAVCVTLSAAGHSLTGAARIPYWSLGVACALVFVITLPLAGRERSLPGIAGLLAAGQVALHALFSCGPATASPASAAPHAGAHSDGGAGLRSLAAQLLCGEQSAGGISDSRARRIVSDAGLDPDRLGGGAGPSGHGELAHHSAGHGLGHGQGQGQGHGPGHEAVGGAMSAADITLECLRTAAHAALSSLDMTMLLGHLLAALALGWLLRRGETALWQLVRLSARSARTAVTYVRALRTAVAYVRALRNGLLPQSDVPAGAHLDSTGDQRTPRPALLHHSVHRRGPPQTTRQESLALAA